MLELPALNMGMLYVKIHAGRGLFGGEKEYL